MDLPRREFLKTSVAAGLVGAFAPALTAAAAPGAAPADEREYYDLRSYRLRADGSRALLDRYLEATLIPGLRARGVGPIGVFEEVSAEPASSHEPTLWVLIPHRNLASYVAVVRDFNADPAVQASAGPYFADTRKAATAAYTRIDSALFIAFAGQPKLRLPAARASATRVFELRTYTSVNEERALEKVAMFNDGEIEVMHDVGLSPVFYGQALAGPSLPQLTYMTSGPDMETHLQHWKAFGDHPVWVKLKNDKRYADTVAKITKWFLKPAAYSEV